MRKELIPVISESDIAPVPVVLKAEPQPIEVDLQRLAVIVVDMQNAFISEGGMYTLWGRDVSDGRGVIEPIKRIASAARAKSCKVLYTAHRYSADLHETGGPSSSNWYKSREVYDYLAYPEWRDKFLASGTWGVEIVKELSPQEGDIVVEKARYSAFFETNLDTILRAYGIRYLVFVGVATNVCVESSIRDACFRGYFPILVSDATAAFGPPYVKDATIYNVKLCLGWVTTAADITRAMA